MIDTVQLRSIDGEGQVILDGADVGDHMSHVTVDWIAGEPPAVTLELAPSRRVSYDGPADVYVVDRQDVRAWLEGLDPDAIDRALLLRPQKVKPGTAVLEALYRLAGDEGTPAAADEGEDVAMPDRPIIPRAVLDNPPTTTTVVE